MFDKSELKQDLDMFFYAAMNALCNCYDNTKGIYPDKCDCDSRKHVHRSIKLLVEEHKKLVKKYDL